MKPASRKPLFQILARYPRPGLVKTRLMNALSPAEACAVHVELLLQTARCVTALQDVTAEIWLDEIADHACLQSLSDLGVRGPRLQVAGDLGRKMCMALNDGLQRADTVLLVGSDCPGLDRDYLTSAVEQLAGADVVLGPAEDGGYVLVGCCRKLSADILSGVSWGGANVLGQTLERLEEAGLHVAFLPERFDIDTPDDLQRWRRECAHGSTQGNEKTGETLA